jgi:hypothetical protein
MKRLFHFSAILALGLTAASCHQHEPGEQKRQLRQTQSNSPVKGCSIKRPFDCESFSQLKATPDFKAELLRFTAPAQSRQFINDPAAIGYADDRLARVPETELPNVVNNDLIFVESCPERDCGDNGAAILRAGKILALAAQYSRPPYHERFSDLEIFVERKTKESAEWIKILKNWGMIGEKTRIYELAALPPVSAKPEPTAPDCSLKTPEACINSFDLTEKKEFTRELASFTRGYRGSYIDKNATLSSQISNSMIGGGSEPELIGGDLVLIQGCALECGPSAAVIISHGKIVAAALSYTVSTGFDAEEHQQWNSYLDIFIDHFDPQSSSLIQILRQWESGPDVTETVHELAPVSDKVVPAGSRSRPTRAAPSGYRGNWACSSHA